MKEKVIKNCENCEYFIQHYMNYMGEYIPVRCGTCMCNKTEKKKPSEEKGCIFWKKKK